MNVVPCEEPQVQVVGREEQGAEPLRVRVVERSVLSEDTVALRLVSSDGQALPDFAAGAHVDLHLPNGMIRQYSICSPPGVRASYRIAVLREVAGRGGSRCVHQQVRVGDVLRMGRPRNLFPLHPAAHAVLVAGGIGITPLLAMAYTLAEQGASFELHYTARSAERAAFRSEILQAPWAERATCYFDDLPAARFRVEDLFAAVKPDSHVYVCGPGGFLDVVARAAEHGGIAPAHVHYERFAVSAVAPEVDAASPSECDFEVEVPSLGKTVVVRHGETVVKALQAHGVAVPVSCEQGICGTCTMRLLGGEAEHRDMCLTQAEREELGRFVPCCSRAISKRLTIDFL